MDRNVALGWAAISCALIFGCSPGRLSLGLLPPQTSCIAILPFESRNDDSQEESLSELLAIDLFQKGARGVLGPMEVKRLFREAGDPLPPAINAYWAGEIGRKLGVDGVIFGSVSQIMLLHSGDELTSELYVNVEVQLIDQVSNEIRWLYGVLDLIELSAASDWFSHQSELMSNRMLSERSRGEQVGAENCWRTPAKALEVAVRAAPTPQPSPTPAPLTELQRGIFNDLNRGGLRLDANGFEGRSRQLTKRAIPFLRDLGVVLQHPTSPAALEIQGHMDATDDSAGDLEASRLRAEAVKTYLVTFGVDEKKLHVSGVGGTKPRLPNINEKSREANRRVEFSVKP